MSAEVDIGALVDAQLAAYNDHDLDRFLACFTPDFEFLDFPNTLRFRGRLAAGERYEALFQANPRLRAEIRTRIVAAPLVVDHEFLYGHGRRPDGVNGVVVYEFEGSLISRVWSGAWSDQDVRHNRCA